MASFLDEPITQKSLDEKLKKLSDSTRRGINKAIRSFDRFCQHHYSRSGQDVLDELKLFKGEELHDKARTVVQNWINWQYENNNMTSGIKLRVSQLKTILRHNQIKVHFEDFNDPLEYTKEVKEELHELTRPEIQTVFKVASARKISFYLALISTGARPGELLHIRKKDLDFSGQRVKIRIEAETTKTRAGRSVWLTKEAARYLMIRIRELKDDDLIWTNNENPLNAEIIEGQIFARYIDKVGLGKRYKSNKRRMITLYSFRSFFFGRASDVHREGYANRMVGHEGYLPQYDRMSDTKKLDWFLKLEPELIIDETERQKQSLEEKAKEISELQKANQLYQDALKEKDEVIKQRDLILDLVKKGFTVSQEKKLGMGVE